MAEHRTVRLDWTGAGLRFAARGTQPETPGIEIDGDAITGLSPMVALLVACGGCSGADVVEILRKMRVRLARCSVEVDGTRRAEAPRRYIAIRYRYRLSGEGLDRAKAERAVTLSLEKYCSVIHSMAADINVDYTIELVD